MVLVLCLVSVLSLSCRSAPEEPEYQVVTVQRDDLTIDVISSGNLIFAYQEELAFEVPGTVGEVLVEVGDSVEEGQVLANLDDTSIISLQKTMAQARIDLDNAQEALEEAENPHTELDIAQAEASVANAKVALETAQEALEEAENPYTEADITQAELAVVNAEIALDVAQNNFDRAEWQYNRNRTYPPWRRNYEQKLYQLAIAELDLTEAEDDLAEMEAGADPLEVEQKQKQLAVAQANLTKAEDDLAEILGDVDSLEVELRQLEVAAAQAALDEAIEQLEMATMVAPFAGVITAVNIDDGDEVNAGTTAIQLADLTKFEAEILVNEMDILGIRPGASASIQVDAMGGASLPARVTSISPTATIQSGVVNYKVTVELESLESLMSELEPPAPFEEEQQPSAMPGSIDQALDKAVTEGLISQEQADFMKERIKQMGGNLSEEQIEQFIERFAQMGGGFGHATGPGQRPEGMMAEPIELREGLTVTVSIIILERNDVLLVPNQAIIYQGQETFVQVLVELEGEEGGTAVEERSVVIGLSDWQNTEIIQGLSEGEQVVIPQATSTSPTTPQPRSPFPMFRGGDAPH